MKKELYFKIIIAYGNSEIDINKFWFYAICLIKIHLLIGLLS